MNIEKIPLQKAKTDAKQRNVAEYFQNAKLWDASTPKAKKLDECIAEMLVMDDLPFSHVEDIGFMRLMTEAAPLYSPKQQNFYSSMICSDMYESVFKKIKEIINEVKQDNKLSFTTDVWSDTSAGVSLLSLTAHTISKEFERANFVLGAQPLEKRHTGEYISKMYDDMLMKWDISCTNVHCVLRDAGENMKKALFLSGVNNLNCTVHKIQLIAKTGLSSHCDIENMVQDELKKIQDRLQHTTSVVSNPVEEIHASNTSSEDKPGSASVIELNEDRQATQAVNFMKEAMQADVEKRFSWVENEDHEDLYRIATYIDPRYKKEEDAEPRGKRRRDDKSETPTTCGTLDEAMASIIASSSDDETEKSSVVTLLMKDIEKYHREKRISGTSQDSLQWWKTMKTVYPDLAKVACHYLSCPPSSDPSEQLFSSACLIYDAKHNRLLPEKLTTFKRVEVGESGRWDAQRVGSTSRILVTHKIVWVCRLCSYEFDLKRLQPRVKYGSISLIVWDAIWSDGRSELVECQEHISSVKYVSIS
ncbi:zinc finger BED domain-containing protein 4-like [Oratosquilla oratoria]|uniref:zinc finger BED domain-containing protein 4-like n=1 Tax=Oratosquilla oratoria TaxID=337810 RepID=UPI003F75DD3C